MKNFARSTAQLAITVALSTGLSLVIPIFVDHHEYAHAVINYANNPNSKNEAALRMESAEQRRQIMASHLIAAGILFVLMNAGWWLLRRRPRAGPSGSSGV